MTRNSLFAIAVTFPLLSNAAPGQDNWGDAHAKFHWLMAVGSGAVASHFIDDPLLAYGASLLPLIAREEWKRAHGFSHYQPSRNVAHLLGAGIGLYGERCLYTLRSVTCAWEF